MMSDVQSRNPRQKIKETDKDKHIKLFTDNVQNGKVVIPADKDQYAKLKATGEINCQRIKMQARVYFIKWLTRC